MTPTTLITGADGYLGLRLTGALLAGGDDHLVLAVRAADATELAAKGDRLVRELDPPPGRVSIVPADVRRDDAFADVDPRPVTRIVHAAAITRFNVERDVAERVNIAGTDRAIAFARRCGGLQRFVGLSTLYSSGRRQGAVSEVRHDDVGFVNHYEWSKWSAEELLLDAGDLPVSVLRLPTVIADDDSGRVTQYNAFHNTMKLFFYGLLSLVPGDPATPLSLATAEFTTAAVRRLADPACPAGVYHVCSDPADTPTLGQLIDWAYPVFERDEQYRRRGLLRPVYCDRASFDDLVEVSSRLRGGPIEESITSVAPFGTQLYLGKTFRNDALRSAWPGYTAPNPRRLVESVCDHLVASRWGRHALTRHLEDVS